MASLTDSPALTANIQGSRRDYGLLNRGYREAKRRGNLGQAFQYAQMGESMGLPIGRPARMEELEGVGRRRYADDLMMQRRLEGQVGAPQGGLNYDDFQHSPVGNPSIGGYNFNQRQKPFGGQTFGGQMQPTGQSLLPQPRLVPGTGYQQGEAAEGPMTPMQPNGMQDSAGNAYPSIRNVDRRAAFSRAWQNARTQAERDSLVERAHGLGVPMNDELALPSLQRRGRSLLPAPNDFGSGPAYSGMGPRKMDELEGSVTSYSNLKPRRIRI